MKIIWYQLHVQNEVLLKLSHAFLLPCHPVHGCCGAAAAELRPAAADTPWRANPKMFTIWPFTEKACRPLPEGKMR